MVRRRVSKKKEYTQDLLEIQSKRIAVPIGSKKVTLLYEYLTHDGSLVPNFNRKDRIKPGIYLLSLKELSSNAKGEENICLAVIE